MKRRKFFGTALASAAFAVPTRLLAHADHFYALPVLVYGARRSPHGTTIDMEIILTNTFAVAATLREFSSPIAKRITIRRRRSLLGVEAWQSVSWLRLEVGENLVLAPPEYSVTAHGIDAPLMERLEFKLVADFGPLGEYASYVNTTPVATNPRPLGH